LIKPLLLPSAIALIVGSFALTACAHKQEGAKVDPSLNTLVPSDTVLLAGTRLEALLKTPIYQRNFAQRQFPQIDEFAQRTGLDPRKDLWELLFVSNGRQNVLLGRGKFGDEMMMPKFEKEGMKTSSYKGSTLVGNDAGAMLLINPTTAALGDIPSLHLFIDHRETSHGPPAPMLELLKEIPPDAQFWGVYGGGPIHLPLDGSLLANVNKLLSTIRTGTLYFDLRTGITSVVSATCANEEGAQEVAGALKALVGLGRLSVPKNQPELAQVYDTIRVTQESTRVKLYIDVPEAMADKFLGVWLGGR
jgi:hypothetical protein